MPRVKTKVGFRGKEKEIEVTIPDGEPAPWGLDAQLKHVGTDVPRIDGVVKVTGRAKYTYDQRPPGMLWGKILHAPLGAATIKSLDVKAAKALPGVKAVYLFKDVGRPLRYHGDEVLAIAGDSEEDVEEALALVKIQYDRKPVVTTVQRALQEGAPSVFEGEPNLKASPRSMGDKEKVLAAMRGADKVIEATYSTQVQTHSSLETHGALAMYEKDGSLTLYCSTQATFGVKGEAVKVSGLADDKVRVVAEMVGGGFGSKFNLSPSGRAAIELARMTKRPVKLMLTREGEHTTGGNRPSSIQRMRAGVKKDGTITAFSVESHGTGGVGGGAGVANPVIYQLGERHKAEAHVYTNAGPAAAMRAPGYPQGVFALEGFLDELAHAIGMDPLELRRKNMKDEVYLAQWELGAKKIGWERRNKVPGAGKGVLKRGIGMASSLWQQMGGPGTEVDIVIHKDGTVEARNGAQDIGTGTRTVMATITAEELGLKPTDIKVSLGDTRWPKGPGSGGSRTAPSIGPATRTGAYQAKLQLLELASKKLGVPADELRMENGLVAGRGQRFTFAEACRLIGDKPIEVRGKRAENYEAYNRTAHGCMFVEVEVDTETGGVRVVKLVTVQDAGRIIDKLLFESQIIGGAIQGISYALHEERILDKNYGAQMNTDLSMYKIAGTMEMPEIVAVPFDLANAGNNCGMMGVGEPPNIPTAAAIANAIFNATGVRVRSLPMTPDKVLAALEARRAGKPV